MKSKIYEAAQALVAAKDEFVAKEAGMTFKAIANSLIAIEHECQDVFLEIAERTVEMPKNTTTTIFVELDGDFITSGCDSCGEPAVSSASSTPEQRSTPQIDLNEIIIDDNDDKIEDRTVLTPPEPGYSTESNPLPDLVVADGVKSADRVAYTDRSDYNKKNFPTKEILLAHFGGDYDMVKKWAIGNGIRVNALKGDVMLTAVWKNL